MGGGEYSSDHDQISRFTPGKEPQYPLKKRLSGTRDNLGGYGGDKISCIHLGSKPVPSEFKHMWSHTPAPPYMPSGHEQGQLYFLHFTPCLLLLGWLGTGGLDWRDT